jgi:pilus assembly protein CpaE
MFPLNVVLIGCSGDLLQLLRLELSVHAAKIEAEFLGVEGAISTLRPPPQVDERRGKAEPAPEAPRRLFIVHLDSAQELPAIKRLGSFFLGNPILVLISNSGDSSIPITAMRMGASQVVMLPLQAEDFKQALDCISAQFGSPMGNRVIAFAGSTGGCGATTIAINVAFEIAQQKPIRVILAELSLQVGKLPLYLNVEPRFTTHDLLKEVHRLDLYFMQQALTPIVDRFHILAGPYHAMTPLNVPTSDVLLLIECLRQLADVIVLDVPCTYDPMYFETLNAADDILLVAEQKVPSIRALQMIHENLGEKPHHMVLNRYDPDLPGFNVERLKQMLHVDEIFTITSDYASVSAAVNQGLPLRLKEPRCKVLSDITHIAQKLVPIEETKDSKKGTGMFGGLIRRLGIKK